MNRDNKNQYHFEADVNYTKDYALLKSLGDLGITSKNIVRNPSIAVLYELGLQYEVGTSIVSSGALAAYSGEKTGRSPADKRITDEETTRTDIWWGPVNTKLPEQSFMINRERAIDYLNTRDRIFIVDGFAGWDPAYRIKVRIVCARAYHALFMRNMLIRPTDAELADFGTPDFVVINAGQFPANIYTEGMTSRTSIDLNFKRREFVILGTEYAGEMKKGVFTIMHYLMPKAGVLSLHSSANEGEQGDVSVFFGLSGTGKTTLSADPKRKLIGDDEHCWSDNGIFNIEGGCYAKCDNLSLEKEPEIFDAVRFGAILENVVYDPLTRVVKYEDLSITVNTRCSYPIEYIPNAKIPCIGPHPKNIIFLTCDGFGVLPPVSKLTTAQAMYHFISGYTSKMPGTEQGIKEPTATFSACFGQPFLALHPVKYATMLAEKLEKHKADVWLINTGWTAGKFGIGKRMPLKVSRAIIDAIHSGELAQAEYDTQPIFNLRFPKNVSGVPADVLNPIKTWHSADDFNSTLKNLGTRFADNFKNYKDNASAEVIAAGPQLN
jgi:ATP-dependent phosphoenolpyruvate carboxykinase